MPSDDQTAADADADATGGEPSGPGPTPPEERVLSLDVLRGFALLGILVINVWLFGLPLAASTNPALYGGFTGLDYAAWAVSHVLFEQKFVTLFTFLFGAGVVLFTDSKERKDQPALRLHYRRGFWLLAAGLAHAYLLWYGDILVAYALCGFLVVFLREWPPKRLLAAGLVAFSMPALLYLLTGVSYLTADAAARAAIEANLLGGFGGGAVEAEIAAYRGGWLAQMSHRVPTSFSLQTSGFIFETGWLVGGLMAVGMALYKWGVLTNDRSTRFYRRLLVGAGGPGLALVVAGVWYRELVEWNTVYVLLFARQFNYWGSLLVALSYVAGVMLLCRAAGGSRLAGALAAVGRTAFSNYLLQTLLATTLFYGHGLGLFARLSRAELLVVVLGIWAVQVPLSVAWLRRFRFGPVEWAWRTLTYGEKQPLRAD